MSLSSKNCINSFFSLLLPAVCAEQPSGGEEHAAAEPSAGLRSAPGSGGHADRGPRDSLGENQRAASIWE